MSFLSNERGALLTSIPAGKPLTVLETGTRVDLIATLNTYSVLGIGNRGLEGKFIRNAYSCMHIICSFQIGTPYAYSTVSLP